MYFHFTQTEIVCSHELNDKVTACPNTTESPALCDSQRTRHMGTRPKRGVVWGVRTVEGYNDLKVGQAISYKMNTFIVIIYLELRICINLK
jgi:hypothetical protein